MTVILHMYYLVNMPRSHLVNSGANRPLQNHLQHFGIRWVLMSGKGQFLCLLLHVLNGYFNGCGDDLKSKY